MKSLVLLILFIVVFTFKGYSQVEIPVFEKMSGRWAPLRSKPARGLPILKRRTER